MLYSRSTFGFYDPQINVDIPADAVDISDDEYANLLRAQAMGKRIAPDENGFPIAEDPPAPTAEQTKLSKWAFVQSFMDQKAMAAGFRGIDDAVTYAEEPAVPTYQAQGSALRAWRSLVRAKFDSMLGSADAAVVPDDDALIAALPALQLPSS